MKERTFTFSTIEEALDALVAAVESGLGEQQS